MMRNLHVVFTMNPSCEGLKDRTSTSPALFNRCVLNWFGDWSGQLGLHGPLWHTLVWLGLDGKIGHKGIGP